MPRIISYPTVSGGAVRRVCAKSGPKPLPDGQKRRRVDVTLAPSAIKRGQAQATEMGLSFSRYVEFLIYADCMCIESV
jgi:hypothetical protein